LTVSFFFSYTFLAGYYFLAAGLLAPVLDPDPSFELPALIN